MTAHLDGLDALIADADAILGRPLDAVTDKPTPGPSGDPHDFYSIGRYSWPNPETADGLPWIRRDCDVNDASYEPGFDLTRTKAMIEAVVRLSLAYRHTGREVYARNAAQRLDTWFLAPETAMNTNLNQAAALPGVHDGVFYGIIQGQLFCRIPYAAALLAGSPHWPAARDRALQQWFAKFTEWLVTSPFGREQAAHPMNNNTRIWYHTQLAVFGHYASDAGTTVRALRTIRECLDGQIALDGSLPEELRRAESLVYSVYCLAGVATAAGLGPRYGVDLWGFHVEDGRTLRSCFDYLAPYLLGDHEWPDPRASRSTPDQAIWLFRLAASAYRDPSYLEVARRLATRPADPASNLFGDAYDDLFVPFTATGGNR